MNYKRYVSQILKNIYHIFRQKYELKHAVVFDILEEDKIIKNKIDTLKPVTEEKLNVFPVYHITTEGSFKFYSPEQALYKFNNATVFPKADYILLQEPRGAVWDKSYFPDFSKVIPLDQGLLNYTENKIYIKKPKEVLSIERAFTLCGVHSTIWSHFLLQFLPKLYYLYEKRNKYDENFCFLLPHYDDKHMIEIITTFIRQYYSKSKIVWLENNQVVFCQELLFIPTTTKIHNHGKYIIFSDTVSPKVVSDLLKKYLIIPYTKNLKDNRVKNIYLVRKGTYRSLTNAALIEDFFSKKGFELVEPHKLTLIEKITLFYNANIIVGPYSSAFSNVIFSKPGTKLLLFLNIQRIADYSFGFYFDYFKLDTLAVTGSDSESENPHSNFYIPLDKIEAAFNQLISEQ